MWLISIVVYGVRARVGPSVYTQAEFASASFSVPIATAPTSIMSTGVPAALSSACDRWEGSHVQTIATIVRHPRFRGRKKLTEALTPVSWVLWCPLPNNQKRNTPSLSGVQFFVLEPEKTEGFCRNQRTASVPASAAPQLT